MTLARVGRVAVLSIVAAFVVIAWARRRGPSEPSAATRVGDLQQSRPAVPREQPTPADRSATFWRRVNGAAPGAWVTIDRGTDVLAPGPSGAWDDFKVGSPVALADTGGSRYQLWYRGCHFLDVDYACGIGHAVSTDGVVWDRSAQPVLVPPNDIDRERLDTIAIARGADGYALWYSVSPAWFKGRRSAVVYGARSRDGMTWESIVVPVYTAVAQARRLAPAAVWDGARFHVWLIDSRSPIDPTTGRFPEMPEDGDDVILHFTSADGSALHLEGAMPLRPLRMDPATLWVERTAGGFRALFYEQHPLGPDPQGVVVLRSTDGTSWTRSSDESAPLAVRTLGSTVIPLSLTAVPLPDGLLTWFVVRYDRGGEGIRLAFHKNG